MQLHNKWLITVYCVLLQLLTTATADEILYLELVINGQNTRRIVEVTRKENDWEIAMKELTALNVKIESDGRELIRLSEIPNSQVIYDSELQRLLLSIPSNLLPLQHFGANAAAETISEPSRDTGLFINYNASSVYTNNNERVTSLWSEQHFFNEQFILVNNGMVQDSSSYFSHSGYTRFDTYLQFDNEEKLHTRIIGDVINATPNWGRSIRMGGIRIARDYALNPNIITYPLPEFYGESALPGSVDLIINDQLNWREQVNSGPFLINLSPYISGAGTAQIITTNAQGQQVQQAVNFYITNELLAPNMLDYDFTLGVRRNDFGLASNNYGEKPLVSSSIRYGINRQVTSQLLMQAGEGLMLMGGGLTFLAGNSGVIDLSASHSHYRRSHGLNDTGAQASIAYNYTRQKFGINANFIQRYDEYRDLGDEPYNVLSPEKSDRIMQIGLSLYDAQMGSFNLGYFRTESVLQDHRSVLNFSWNRFYKNDVNIFLNLSRSFFERTENIASLSVSIPFGTRGQASYSIRHDPDNGPSNQFQAMHNAPYEGGLSWGVNIDDSIRKNRHAALNWRTPYAELALGANKTNSNYQYSGALSGALVLMGDSVYSTRFITDAFAVVETTQADIPVLMGHQLVGHTNSKGKLLVPDLDSYLENRLAIDPLILPANARIDAIEQLVTPSRQGGIRVKFPVTYSQSVLARVMTINQQPLPAGAVLADQNSDKNFTIGWDGDLYIEDIQETLRLFWADGECFIDIPPPTDAHQALPRVGPYICLPVAELSQ